MLEHVGLVCNRWMYSHNFVALRVIMRSELKIQKLNVLYDPEIIYFLIAFHSVTTFP